MKGSLLQPQVQWILEGKKKFPRMYMTKFLSLSWKRLAQDSNFRNRCPKKIDAELSALVVGLVPGKKLNCQYRKKNYATDVLSFEGDFHWGDLILCDEVIARHALERGIPFREELAYVVLHGILHLAGFDHEISQKEEKIMFDLQDRVYNHVMKQMGSRRRLILA